MWIVRLALRRPYTFVVMAILILIMGTLAIVRTPTDIFPNINIPVVSIIWNYNGLVPEDMATVSSASQSGSLPPPLTTSSTSNRSRCMESLSSKCSCSRTRTLSRASRRLRRSLRPNSGSCLRERRRRSFSPTAHRVCPSCSWRSRGKIFQSKNSTTMA